MGIIGIPLSVLRTLVVRTRITRSEIFGPGNDGDLSTALTAVAVDDLCLDGLGDGSFGGMLVVDDEEEVGIFP